MESYGVLDNLCTHLEGNPVLSDSVLLKQKGGDQIILYVNARREKDSITE